MDEPEEAMSPSQLRLKSQLSMEPMSATGTKKQLAFDLSGENSPSNKNKLNESGQYDMLNIQMMESIRRKNSMRNENKDTGTPSYVKESKPYKKL